MITSTTEDRTIHKCEDRPLTAPEQFTVNIRGFESAEKATEVGQLVGECVRELSRIINLQELDGITIAVDYGQALAQLDRGYNTTHKLSPTDEHGVGVAMTPSVMRNGNVKSHMVFSADLILPLAEPESEGFGLALHLLAHECAHVELTSRFDKSFPCHILQKQFDNMHQGLRWQVINACWNEYGATWISANIGRNPTGYYEDTFARVLNSARPKANDRIKAFQQHTDVSRVFSEVYITYGELMKFASYLLGTMNGLGLSLSDIPNTRNALENHWFFPFFVRLQNLLQAVGNNYGKWTSQDDFEAIGNLADEVIAHGGVKISGNRFYVDFL